MKQKWLVTVAAALLVATSAFAQTLVCVERVVDGTGANWYASEGRMVVLNGESRLAYDPFVVHEPNGTYPIVYYYLQIGGSPTSDSFAGTGEFTFPPQEPGIEIQVHYQKAGDDWDIGTTTKYAGSQVVKCPHMVVPKGFKISFVVRVKVEDWVPDGTPINVELKSITGLYGVTLQEIPELQMVTYTGPWKMKWWKHPVITAISRKGDVSTLKVQSPPHFWGGNWYLEASENLGSWSMATSALVPLTAEQDELTLVRQLEVPSTAKQKFYRFALGPN